MKLLIVLFVFLFLAGCRVRAIRSSNQEIKIKDKQITVNNKSKKVVVKEVVNDSQLVNKNSREIVSKNKQLPVIITPETENQKKIRLLRKKLKSASK